MASDTWWIRGWLRSSESPALCLLWLRLIDFRGLSAVHGVEILAVSPTSRANARQRTGRAGREVGCRSDSAPFLQAPGRCYRLYPEAEFFKAPENAQPEIQRSVVTCC